MQVRLIVSLGLPATEVLAAPAATTLQSSAWEVMPQREVEIVNPRGLNAEAAAKLAQLAAKYQYDVWLTRNARRVNAKSLMGVMMLAAARGSRVVLATDGPDEVEALGAITALIADHFGEVK